MEEHYENVRSNFIEGIQAPNSSSLCPGEYAELSIINKQDTVNQYATVEAVGQQKLMSSANRNEIDQPEGKVLKSTLPCRKKECCICCTALIFFLIFIVSGFALTAYNYYHLESVKSQLKILKREFSQLEESSTIIGGIQQKQILYNILENIELLNTSSIDKYKKYDTKIMEINQRQLKVNENIEQLNISALEERSEVYYSLVQDISLYSNISFHVNNIIDNIGLFEEYPASSCRYIHALHQSWPSGHYWVINQHGVTVHAYCNMGSLCVHPKIYCHRGWTRIAKLNKIVNRAQCFMGLKNYPTNRSSCVTESDSATCSSTFFSSFDIPYSGIHGRIRAYGVGTPEGFRSSTLTINDNYVDGISVTVGNTANRQYIHTLVPASGSCYPLSNRPAFVSSYGCLPVLGTGSSQCSGSSCSRYFTNSLATPTTEAIEMRICRDQSRSDEDIIIEDLEIHVI